ncbi:outer membrane protein transport protein [Mesosutterella sp. OilRF-GAM-744-9]|uniref:Outer membrane protein transport protein n=1 Tax=Mesosutterella porci TaxID=2915351 RepID=A0ABS9MTJ3_9BURK|nr:outer membrane protein transport protein [Mesosutterella sp. oilRF-744-WT-GAM-9]MCG5031919.1 outer membrane protein transport protein [Mesosutterella sp. oilRF-744-WT-GAM-9]
MTHFRKLAAAAAGVAAALASSGAFAAGFQLNEQSIVGMGRSYAGEGIMGDDVSAAWYNPAGLTLLPGTQIQVGGMDVELDLEYKGKDGGSENGRKRSSPILHQMMSRQFSDRLWGGLAFVMPYGLSTSYGADWAQNQRGYDARLLAVTINPSLAWKLTDKVSVGAGFQAQHIDATVSMKKNVMGYGAYSRLEADDWGFGWNVGAMWEPTETLRFGFGYRSQMNHNAHGHVKLTADSASQSGIQNLMKAASANSAIMSQLKALAAQNGISSSALMSIASSGSMTLPGGANMKSPANANFTVVWKYSPKLRLSSTIRWTDWSSFDRLIITAGNLPHSSTDIPMKWRDTWFVSLGYDLDITPKWTIRGGVAYDRSPIKDARYRTAIIPDANRGWLSLGASYRLNDRWQFDLAAMHVHAFGNRDLYSDYTSSGEKVGHFKSLNSYLLGAGFVYRF